MLGWYRSDLPRIGPGTAEFMAMSLHLLLSSWPLYKINPKKLKKILFVSVLPELFASCSSVRGPYGHSSLYFIRRRGNPKTLKCIWWQCVNKYSITFLVLILTRPILQLLTNWKRKFYGRNLNGGHLNTVTGKLNCSFAFPTSMNTAKSML